MNDYNQKIFFVILLFSISVILVPVSAETAWTFSNGCWTATDGIYNITMWNTTGSKTWTIPTGVTSLQYVIVAGGGSGGSASIVFNSGGGGAGGYRSSVTGESSGGGSSIESPLSVTPGESIPIVVGGGGASVSDAGGISGGNSSLGSIVSIGGGGGHNGYTQLAKNGGSGGGTAGTGQPGLGTANQGFNGGNSTSTDSGYVGGGGGGAGSVGQNGALQSGGDGGSGINSAITGTSTGYAGGGGGSSGNDGSVAGHATHGGGNGGANGPGSAGIDGTGGGGGAGPWPEYSSGKGGSGVVIVRYSVSAPTPTPTPTPTPSPVQPGQGNWCGITSIFFEHNTSIESPHYEQLSNRPSGNPEVDENITITSSSGPVLIDTYVSGDGSPGDVVLNAGLRKYRTWHYVSSNVGTTRVNFSVYRRDQYGNDTFFYTVLSEDINAVSPENYVTPYVATENLTFTSNDRLVIRVSGETTQPSPITLHFVYQGSYRTSLVESGFFECPQVCCFITPTSGPPGPDAMINIPVRKSDSEKQNTNIWIALGILGVIVILLLIRRR